MPENRQIKVSSEVARRFLISHHQLLEPRQKSGKQAILDLINHLNCIQFDTINVVGRNPDLVLQSRIKDYKPILLEELLYEERKLIDGWDKQASIFQVEDRPNFERIRTLMFEHPDRRYENVKDAIPDIRERLESDGPLSSLDFKDFDKVEWHWSHTSLARATLEFMWYIGQVGVHHRVNTRRSFDLIERLVPDKILRQHDPNETDEEYHDWHVHRRIGGLGLASLRSGEKWAGIVGLKAPERRRAIQRLLEDGRVIEVILEGLEKEPLYIRAEDKTDLDKAIKSSDFVKHTSFIAPLDNLIWNRKLINDLFGFEYVWEVYKPKAKREYGYYILPVLYGDRFIARFDPKFDKKSKKLHIQNWWWEPGVTPDKEMYRSISACFSDFINYLEAKQITFSDEINFAKELNIG